MYSKSHCGKGEGGSGQRAELKLANSYGSQPKLNKKRINFGIPQYLFAPF